MKILHTNAGKAGLVAFILSLVLASSLFPNLPAFFLLLSGIVAGVGGFYAYRAWRS